MKNVTCPAVRFRRALGGKKTHRVAEGAQAALCGFLPKRGWGIVPKHQREPYCVDCRAEARARADVKRVAGRRP